MIITIHTSTDSLSRDTEITGEEMQRFAARVVEVVESAYPHAEARHEFGIQSFVEIHDCEGFQEEDVVRAVEGMVRRVFEAGEFWN